MSQYEVPVYTKRGLRLVRGEGSRVWDEKGRTYIDCISGHGVALVGHNHPRVVQAIQQQAQRLLICPGTFDNDVRDAYIERLIGVTPKGLNRVFLTNSGTESVEAAIKFARVATGRTKLIAMRQGFHGRTLGALSLTWNPKYRRPFAPLLPDVFHIPFGDLEAAQSAIDEHTAAVIIEPVQGEGGVRPATPEYLRGLREICNATGTLLIADEVQTGFGRTGTFLAVEHAGITPDILCLAKGIGGGIPMGAVITTERVASALRPGHHGTTFGGNPLACAAGLAVLDIIESENLPAQAREKGSWLLEVLQGLVHPRVRDIRGLGLMIGIELRERVTPYLRRLQEDYRVLALPAGPTVIRLLPPLTITWEELHTVVDALFRVLNAETGFPPGRVPNA